MQSELPALSDFRLGKLLSDGALGPVWQAQHQLTRLPGAVRVLRPPRYREPAVRAALAAELRAAAGLDHPGLSRVLAWGELGAADARVLGPGYTPGSPYVITDLCSGGDLGQRAGRLGWLDLREVLLAVLDALACAHGRGLLHRGLRPGKVLFATARDARPGPRLIDLGLAQPIDPLRAGAWERPAGAPAYMPPEQLGGRWRDWGPPLDLYALGCVVWEVVTGVVPFRGANVQAIRRAHLKQEPPPMRPQLPVPEGLEAWLRRLLQKEPGARFPSAAAAAEALEALVAPAPVAGWLPAPDEDETAEGLVLWAGQRFTPVCLLEEAERALPERAERAVLRSAEAASATQARLRGSLLPLVGAGLALEPLRRPDWAGREPERLALWQALLRAREDGAVLVLVRGPAGVGRGRLASWVAERAVELGLAQADQVELDPGPGGGLGALAAALLGVAGLRGAEREERVRERVRSLEGDDWLGLALQELLDPHPEERPALASAAVRQEVALELLTLTARQGPRVVVLRGCEHAPEVLALARALQREAEPGLPLLLVLVLPDAPALEPQVEALRAAGAQDLPLGPLPAAALAALCTRLAEGEEDTAALLEAHSQGLPGVAVALRRAWIGLEGLVLTEGGLLALGAVEELPHDPQSAALAELTLAVQGFPDGSELLVELAALLGGRVDPEVWAAAAASLGVAPWTTALPERLAERGLLRAELGGWRLNAWLAAALRARAQERAELLHLAAARGLERAQGRPLEALAGHLLAAGRGEEALGLLLRLAREARLAGDLERAGRWLSTWEALAPAAPGPGLVEQARVLAAVGQPEALALAERAAALPGPHQAEAAVVRAELHRQAGALGEARQALAEALGLLRARPPDPVLAAALCEAATLALAEGEADAARAAWTEALAVAEQTRAMPAAMAALTWLGHDAARRGAGPQAESVHQRALTYALALGDRRGEAHAYNGLAEIARAQGELDRAEACYRRALYLLELLRAPAAASVRLNLGLVRLRQEAWEEADALLKSAAAAMSAQGRAGFDALAVLFRLPCTAAAGRWEALEAQLRPLAPLLRPEVFTDADVAWSLDAAGRLALAAGRAPLARALLTAAAAQWSALGSSLQAESARALL